MAKKILLAGATGLVGEQLIAQLLNKGYEVNMLARNASSKNIKGINVFDWDVYQQIIDHKAFEGVDTVINLTGEGIADKPWTQERKKQIIDSRVMAAQLIFQAIKASNASVKHYISASAVGFYGDRADEILDEESAPGTGFLADCCVAWEKAADQGILQGIRVVKIRIGIVLSARGGALPTIAKPINMFVGAPLGSGKQWMPWIHIDDLVNMFIKAVEDENMFDAYNACAPSPASNTTFTHALGKVLHRPIWPFNVPKFALKTLLGEMSILPLMSNNTSAQKILNTGFQFRYLDLKETLKAIYERKK